MCLRSLLFARSTLDVQGSSCSLQLVPASAVTSESLRARAEAMKSQADAARDEIRSHTSPLADSRAQPRRRRR